MDVGRISSALIIFVSAVVEVLIVLRLILMLFAANSSAAFTSWVYDSTDPLVEPFSGVFPTLDLAGIITLELSSLLALILRVRKGNSETVQ